MKALCAAAKKKCLDWFFHDGWLEVGVVREVALSMLQPFVWQQSAQQPPAGAWRWKGMYIEEDEVTELLTCTWRGFLAAQPNEILEAAKAGSKLKRVRFLE